MLGTFSLVPLVVGSATVAEVARLLDGLWGGPETLVVISTDLSHYHSYDDARRIDEATLKRIAACAIDLEHGEACGATPLNALLLLARRRNVNLRLLAACNSGDTAGGKTEVVGYSSFALYERPEVALHEAGSVLLRIAADAIEERLYRASRPAMRDAWLQQAGAAFVTVKKAGALRGCIGSLTARRPLADDVAENAVGAAFGDPRFPVLEPAEWPDCRVEVSVLSRAKPIRFADEDDLLTQIRPGEDGLILEADGRRATFLPQVWESVPDARLFLRELVRKAGLPADTRFARCRILRYRVAKFDGS